jgi:glutamate carboxypeptidase
MAKTVAGSSIARERLTFFEQRKDKIVETIRELVSIESPSDNKAALDTLAEIIAAKFETLGGRPTIHKQHAAGNHVQVDFGARDQKPVLLLGHYDTVYAMGTLATMPCRVADGRVWGPGSLDMKGGIALMLEALAGVRDAHGQIPRAVTVFLNSDEEVGSDSSRGMIEALARKCAAVLVCEPAAGLHGALKTARKGVGGYHLRVTGHAAHAGLDFSKGASAILELAHQITEISKLSDLERGTTVNVGVIRGGTRTNVIAAEASAEIDVRIAHIDDGPKIDAKLRAVRPLNHRCKLELSGGINRPPMERTEGVARLYSKAVELAHDLGWKAEEAAVGGGSDGNFTTAVGAATLDGLGAVGEGAHATHESVIIDELPRRAALLCLLIEKV